MTHNDNLTRFYQVLIAILFVISWLYIVVDTIYRLRTIDGFVVLRALTLLSITAGIGVALWVHHQKVVWDRSEAYLEKAIDLVMKAYSVLLNDDNELTNKRVPWVTSARLITRSEEIANKMTDESHVNIFTSERDYFRHKFHELLKMDGETLPAAFFCGVDDMSLSIVDAAKEGAGSFGDTSKCIPSRVVSVIYNFKSYPKDYIDPLVDSKVLPEDDIDRLDLFGEDGVSEYLRFFTNNSVKNGKVYPRNNQ